MTYTDKQLREIDVKIAQSLGWRVDAYQDGYEPVRYRLLTPDGPLSLMPIAATTSESNAWELVPRFTTDANAALSLMLPSWSLWYVPMPDVWDYTWVCETANGYYNLRGRDTTAALSICRARFAEFFEAVQS